MKVETSEESGMNVAGLSGMRADVAEVRGVWRDAEGRVAWSLGSAWGTAGFYVYRVDPESGKETRLNDSLLPVAFNQSDAAYEVADPLARENGEGTYRLEEVELSGDVRDLGATTVVFAPPPAPAMIARTVKSSARALLNAAPAGVGPSSVLKVLLKKEGIYGVSLASIADGMGLALEDVQALAEEGALCIRSQSRPVSVIYDEVRGRVVFHGQSTDDWYTRDASYLISVGEGWPMPRREPDATVGDSVFPVQIRFEEDRFPFDTVVQRPEDFYYWKYIISTTNPAANRVDFAINLDGYEGGALTLKVDLQGWSQTARNPDHRAEFSLNGMPVGEIEFDDQNPATAVLAIPAGAAANGANVLTVRGALTSAADYSYFVLDGLTAEYDRVLAPREGTEHIRADGTTSVSAQAFADPLVLALDEEGWFPTWIADGNGELPAKAWQVSESDRRFAVIEADAVPLLVPQPAAADAWFMSETNRIDYLVITSRALAPAAQELADYRADQGLRVGVAVFEDVCDLMYGGLRTPEAIPELMSYAAAFWAESPQMVVLAGNGHYDYLGVNSNEVNHLPPMLIQTDDGLFAADGLLAECGGEIGPDVAIGRLPARTPEELTMMIAKIKIYEANSGSAWQNQLVFSNDKADDAGDFSASVARFTDLVQDPYSVSARIDLDTMAIGPARTNLRDSFNAGAGFIHYTGHGMTAKWSAQGLLTTADVNAMTNARKPVVVALCCLAGHFEAPAVSSLAELLMQRAQGGAVAVWASSALPRNAPATDLGEAFYRAVLQEGASTLGPAILGALQSQSSDIFTRDTFATYNLLGDPALRIAGNGATNGTKIPAQVFLQNLVQTYDGTARTVTATTEPAGLAVEITYDGCVTEPTALGTYAVVATIAVANYEGSAVGSLVVSMADQTIDFPPIADQLATNNYLLAAEASSGLPVGFAVADGPASIDGTGTRLTFTGTGSVSIVASQPGDSNWNPAQEVLQAFDIVHLILQIEISKGMVNVREGGEGRFFVRLARPPTTNIVVGVSRSEGNDGISVKSGGTLTFKPLNWNVWQAVTLAVGADGNSDAETATFRVSSAGAEDQFVEATALDDDIGENLARASSGSTIAGGSSATRLIDGVHTSSANYGYAVWTNVPPGTMTLDLKAPTTVTRVRLLNYDWSYQVSCYTIESSPDGTTWSSLVDAGAGAHQGWEDWPVAAQSVRYLRFTGLSNSANGRVGIAEWEVYGSRPAPVLVTSTTNVNVRENGEGRFFVKLDRPPMISSTVTVTRSAGDTNLWVKSGGTLTFKPTNWNVWQAVTLAVGEDGNIDAETATFQISSAGAADQYVEATTLDDDIGENLARASSGSTIAGGSSPTRLIDGVHTSSANYGYAVWTNVLPGTMTLDLKAPARVTQVRLLNYDWSYQVQRYTIESSPDGTTWSSLVDAGTGLHMGWENWPVAVQSVRYLRFTGLSNSANARVGIAEWEVYGSRPAPVPVTSTTNVNARENGEGRFFVKLDRLPMINSTVTVTRSAGDTNLGVKSGGMLTFKPTNWNVWQAVTLAAGEDGNSDAETATFQISSAGAADQFVEATALDDDIGENLARASSGSTIAGGSSATRLIDGVHTSSANYGYAVWTNVPPGTMTLDLKAPTTVTRVRLLNYDWSYQVQRYTIESSPDGTTWSSLVDASEGAHQGWEDRPVAAQSVRYLRFTGLSNSANGRVGIAEWEVYGSRPVPVLVTSTTNVNVRENGEGRFFVKLDRTPMISSTVTVTRSAGDTNLGVKSGGTLTFKPTNWNVWQAVTLAAGEDGNIYAETATFRVSSAGAADQYVEATTLDDDIGENLARSSSGSTIAGGSSATRLIDGVHTSSANYGYAVWTNVLPGTMTLDLKAPTTVTRVRLLNYDWSYQVQRYTIESSPDGIDWSLLVDASEGAHQGWEDWPVEAQSVRYLRFTGLSNSANARVGIAELEVYATLPKAAPTRRTVVKEQPIVLAVQPVVAWEGEDIWPVTVVTSDDGPEHTNGWAAVDGDTNTLWVGEAGASGWHIAVGYESTLTMTNLAVDMAEGSLADIQCLTSMDGVDWSPLPADVGIHPVQLNFLWLLFPGDGTTTVPQVIEIDPQQ